MLALSEVLYKELYFLLFIFTTVPKGCWLPILQVNKRVSGGWDGTQSKWQRQYYSNQVFTAVEPGRALGLWLSECELKSNTVQTISLRPHSWLAAGPALERGLFPVPDCPTLPLPSLSHVNQTAHGKKYRLWLTLKLHEYVTYIQSSLDMALQGLFGIILLGPTSQQWLSCNAAMVPT